MRVEVKGFFTALAATMLAGCASVPNVELDKAQSGQIKTFALLRVAESQRFTVRDHSGLPALGGVAGGLVSGNIQAKRTEAFVQQYNRGNVRLASLMVEDLRRLLAQHGAEVSYLPDEAPRLQDGADDYTHISTASDAILNVWFGATGYVADGPVSADYEPWLMVNVRVLNAKTKKVVYQKTFTGGYKVKIENAVLVPCATGHRFSTFDALMASFERAVEGIADCQRAIVQRIVDDLK